MPCRLPATAFAEEPRNAKLTAPVENERAKNVQFKRALVKIEAGNKALRAKLGKK